MPLLPRELSHRAARPLVAGGLLLVAAIALLGPVNGRRLGGGEFERAGEALLRDARSVAAKAGPGYQEAALAALPRPPLDGWFLRLAPPEGGGDRHAEPPSGRLWSLEFDDPDELATAPPGAPPARVADGWLREAAAWPSAVTHRVPTAIPVGEIGEIRIAVRRATSPQLVLGWTVEEEFPSDPMSVYGKTTAVDLVPSEEPRVYVVDARALRRQTDSNAVIRRFFLAPSTGPGRGAEVDYLRVVSRVASLSERGTGNSDQRLGAELRRAAFAAAGRSLEFPAHLPPGHVELRFGVGLLGGDAPCRMSAEIVADGARTRLFDATVAPDQAWRDARLDVSAFAGRDVRLILRSNARGDQVALWADPVLRGERRRRFNVVLYLEDTLRADHLSVYGYPRDTSPAKRSFAARAVIFEHAISQATKTRPSVASLMTSLPPSATGVVRFWERLSAPYLTLAEVLHHQGFTTAAMVQNAAAGVGAGLHQGFGLSLDHESVGRHPADVVDAAIPWLRENADTNFFLYVHVIDPHGPWEPEPPDDAWATPLEPDSREERIARYDGEIRAADREFGRFLGALDELGLADDTLVVYGSDHGEYLGEEGLRWGHEPPGDPPVIHVPLMLAYPAGLEGGRRVRAPVQLMDVTPTILELAGVDAAPLALAGRSLVRLARTGTDPDLEGRMLVSEEPTAHPFELRGEPDATGSLFFDGWQLQRSRARGRRGIRWLIGFRPTRDPDGRRDLLATVDPWTRHRFDALMREWQSVHLGTWRSLAGPDRAEIQFDPDVNERLRALGYIK